MTMKSSLTILLEAPFWIGLYERIDGDRYEVCKITFGAEPKDYEVYDFLLQNWRTLKFSPPLKADRIEERKINPKRMQREINNQLRSRHLSYNTSKINWNEKPKVGSSGKRKRNASMLYGRKKRKPSTEEGNVCRSRQGVSCS